MVSGRLNPRSHSTASEDALLLSTPPAEAQLGCAAIQSLSFPVAPLMLTWVGRVRRKQKCSRPPRSQDSASGEQRGDPIIPLTFKAWVCPPGPFSTLNAFLGSLKPPFRTHNYEFTVYRVFEETILPNLHISPTIVLLRPRYRCGQWG